MKKIPIEESKESSSLMTALHLGIYLGYSGAFATLASDIAENDHGVGIWVASGIWVLAFAFFCVPFARTILLAVVLCFIIPWWSAIPSACGINVVRWFLLLITDPERKSRLAANDAALKESLRKRQLAKARAGAIDEAIKDGRLDEQQYKEMIRQLTETRE